MNYIRSSDEEVAAFLQIRGQSLIELSLNGVKQVYLAFYNFFLFIWNSSFCNDTMLITNHKIFSTPNSST